MASLDPNPPLLHSLTADGLHRVFPARCNDIQIDGVICQVHFALGLTPGRSELHIKKKGEKQREREGITRRLYLQSNFIPPACVED